MKNNDFLTNLFQIVGFLAAIIIAISQYIFSNQFKYLFISNVEMYYLANTCALGIALATIIGLYANRYFLESKHYFFNQREKYYKRIQEINENSVKGKKCTKEVITEPWTWKISNLGFPFILVGLGSLYFLLSSQYLNIRTISYIVFICSTIDSVTIFSLIMYTLYEYRNNEERNRDRIIEQINKYFAGDFKIFLESENRADPLYPSRVLLIEKGEEKYEVRADANNPNKFFEIKKMTK